MALWWSLLWLGLASPQPGLDARALSARIDAVVSSHVRRSGTPGVVVTVTQGKRVILERAWGLANVQTQQPMDAERTLVRIASLSKTFTATAVAQLEDQGLLELDADVDQYLQRVATAGPWPAPVTVRHLLAHTSGFINYNSGRVRTEPIYPEDFETFIARTMPPRMHAPGTATLYTNHGNALAGLVVQDIAGVAFADHVRATLLDPLQMHHTAYYVDAAQPELAQSYNVAEDGTVTPWPYEYFATVPASAVHTTAHDMGSYLILHATDGRVHGRQILSPSAMQRMRTPRATLHPALGEYHYAFAPTQIHGHAARVHGGSVPAFLSRMAIFDEAGVGVFVAQNAFGPNVATDVIEAVAEALPPPPATGPPVAEGDGRPLDPGALVGDYRIVDKHETAAFTRPRAVLWQAPLRVAVDAAGLLTVDGLSFVRTQALVFQAQSEDGAIESVVFVRGKDGKIAWVHRGRSSAFAIPWHGGRGVQIAAYALALGLLVLGALGTRGGMMPQRRMWRLLAWSALLGTVAPQAFAWAADAGQPVYTHPLRLGIPGWIPVLLWAPRVAAVLAVALSFRREFRHRPGTAIAVGAVLLVALEQYWRTPPPGLPLG